MSGMKTGLVSLCALGLISATSWWLITGQSDSSEGSDAPVGARIADVSDTPDTGTGDATGDNSSAGQDSPTSAPDTDDNPAVADTIEGRDEVLEEFLQQGCIDHSQTRVQQLTPTRRAELDSWLKSEGHFRGISMTSDRTIAPFDDYSSYETDTLRQLARDQQDAKAQVTLGSRLASEGEYLQAAEWFREAAINGYSAPIGRIGFLRLFHRVQEFRDNGRAEDEEARRRMVRQALLEYIAYVEFSAIRGAPMAQYTLRLMRNREVFSASGSGTEGFSDSELALAQARGRELYLEFESERMDRGLPPFDNSRPAIADLYAADLDTIISADEEGLQPCETSR